MRVYVEFIGGIAEKAKRKRVWLETEANITVKALFSKIFPLFIGRDTAETLFKSFLNREIIVVLNGTIATDFETKLNDGDKVYFFPMASGG